MIRAALSLSILAVATGGLLSCTSYRVVRGGELNEKAFRDVQERTANTRGLPFREDVEAEVYTKKKSGEYFKAELNKSDEERARRSDLVAHRLGVLPDGISLRDVFQRALTQNAAGVYVPADDEEEGADAPPDGAPGAAKKQPGRLFIVTDTLPQPARAMMDGFGYLTGTDWGNALFLSHELTHAIQDQHYDLDAVVPGKLYGQNEDMAIARKSIVESEANLVAQAYLLGVDLNSIVQRNLLIEYLSLGRVLDVWLTEYMNPEIPPFYVKVLVEQYSQGMAFLQHTINRGGWKAVNGAYANALPDSTEQLMWPEKFFDEDERDPPRFVPRLDVEVPALQGYERLDGNVFGALLWRIFLEEKAPGVAAGDVAEGWGGDRYDVIEKQDRHVLIWRTVWDSEADAQEFVAAYRAVLQHKYPGRLSPTSGPAGAETYAVSPKGAADGQGVRTELPEVVAIVAAGDRVLVVEGADPADAAAMIDALMAQTVDDEAARPALPPRATEVVAGGIDFVRAEPPPLEKRIMVPHHLVALRLGATVFVDPALRFSPQLDREFTWGFRQHLSWTPPYLFSVDVPGLDRAQTVLTFGFEDLYFARTLDDSAWSLTGTPLMSLTQAFHVTDQLAVLGQGGAEGFWSTDTALRTDLELRGAVALLAQPFPFLMVSGGLGLRGGFEFDTKLGPLDGRGAHVPDRRLFIIGAASERGRSPQPTFEVTLIDGLHLYETSQFFFDPVARRFLGQRHALGLLLYF